MSFETINHKVSIEKGRYFDTHFRFSQCYNLSFPMTLMNLGSSNFIQFEIRIEENQNHTKEILENGSFLKNNDTNEIYFLLYKQPKNHMFFLLRLLTSENKKYLVSFRYTFDSFSPIKRFYYINGTTEIASDIRVVDLFTKKIRRFHDGLVFKNSTLYSFENKIINVSDNQVEEYKIKNENQELYTRTSSLLHRENITYSGDVQFGWGPEYIRNEGVFLLFNPPRKFDLIAWKDKNSNNWLVIRFINEEDEEFCFLDPNDISNPNSMIRVMKSCKINGFRNVSVCNQGNLIIYGKLQPEFHAKTCEVSESEEMKFYRFESPFEVFEFPMSLDQIKCQNHFCVVLFNEENKPCMHVSSRSMIQTSVFPVGYTKTWFLCSLILG